MNRGLVLSLATLSESPTPNEYSLSFSSPHTTTRQVPQPFLNNSRGLNLIVDLTSKPSPAAPIKHRTHLMKLRHMPSTPKALLTHSSSHPVDFIEPTCFSTANKSPLWRCAMSEELNALIRNGTWSLHPPSPKMNIVGCKWVYRITLQQN